MRFQTPGAARAAAAIALGALLAAPFASGTVAAEPSAAGPPRSAQPPLRPSDVWPAGLQAMVGRYTFQQVASPGGLWQTFTPKSGALRRRQVSIHELPAALSARLMKAEIVISDLRLPTSVDATERESPTKRGRLRFYEESGRGHLLLRNCPGVGSQLGDKGDFKGPVLLEIGHQSHSNPSISGIFSQRIHEERTWGAATLDSAYLHAVPIGPGGEPAAEQRAVIGNARILRSAREIFAYTEWTWSAADGRRTVNGSIRLLRREP